MSEAVAGPKLHRFRAMGSPCELQAYGPDERVESAFAAACAEIARLEAKYSRYRDDSLLSRINMAAGRGPVSVDQETAQLLSFAEQAWQQSDGLFDPSAGILRQAWDFKSGRPPTQQALEALLPRIGWAQLRWTPPEISLPAGMELDFGGFVKEYAADAAAAALRAHGVMHGLANLGGDISLAGPHPDGSPWQLGVRNPRAPDQALAQIPLAQGALSSSGDYERCMIHAGRRYCHILNPTTGWPSGALASVSVVAPQCLVAGAVTTVAMLLPLQGALDWLEQTELAYFAVSPDGRQWQGRPAVDR